MVKMVLSEPDLCRSASACAACNAPLSASKRRNLPKGDFSCIEIRAATVAPSAPSGNGGRTCLFRSSTSVTGTGLAIVGGGVFVWWLLLPPPTAAKPTASFAGWATWKWSLIVWIGLTWALFQHMFSGLRHFVMDVGAGYELKTNRILGDLVGGRRDRADRRALGLDHLGRTA